MRMRWAAILLVVAGCGGDLASEVPPDPYCAVGITLETAAIPEIPTTVVLSGALVHNDFEGFRDLEWDVIGPLGDPVAFELRETDATSMEFQADLAGPYEVVLDGEVSNKGCNRDSLTVNALVPGARSVEYLVRVERQGSDHAELVTVYGGANYGLGRIDVSADSFNARVRNASGDGIESLVRFRPQGAVITGLEGVSATDGTLVASLGAGAYDAWVTPFEPDEAPFVYSNFDPTNPPPAIDPISVRNLDVVASAGSPLVGARVRVAASGGPAIVGETGGAGSTALVIGAGPIDVEIAPDSSTGIPRVFLSRATVPTPGLITVDLDPPTVRAATFTVMDGGVVPSAMVILDAELDVGATVDGGATTLPGRFTVVATANGSGQVGPINVPATALTAVVVPPGGTPTLSTYDATSSTPATLSAGGTATVSGTATFAGQPIPGAVVRARALGVLAGRGADRATVAGSDGSYALELAAGESYEISIAQAADGSYAASWTSTVAADAVLDVQASPAIALVGQLAAGASQLTQAHITVVDPETGDVVATGLASFDGSFSLPIPDPGTD